MLDRLLVQRWTIDARTDHIRQQLLRRSQVCRRAPPAAGTVAYEVRSGALRPRQHLEIGQWRRRGQPPARRGGPQRIARLLHPLANADDPDISPRRPGPRWLRQAADDILY